MADCKQICHLHTSIMTYNKGEKNGTIFGFVEKGEGRRR